MKSNSKNIKKRTVASDSFLEALRDLGGGVVDSMVNDVAGGFVEEAIDQLTNRKSGDLRPNQPLNLEPSAKLEEERRRQFTHFNQELWGIRRQEKLIWTRQEQETRLQVATILEELKKLAKSVKRLDQEVEIATTQVPVEPGVYHLSFFEKLKQTIILFRKKVEESINWLAAFNQRAKKRNYYWGQFKKSGTKFLLSQERYMSTQAG